MSRTTFEIIFLANEIDASIYKEASMSSKNSIIVDADNRFAIPCGKEQVKICIKGEYKIYSNVFAVCPYYYNDSY